MTIPKWLLPVLAGITAIAVGTASALIAFVLVGGAPESEPAPVATAVSEAATETVPFIAPVGFGDEAPPLDLDGDPETDDVSPYLGSETVPAVDVDDEGTPIGADPTSIADLIDAETLAAVDTVMAADDPASVPGIVPLFTGGDPCALPGAPSESCPEGLRSRILSLTGLPPLQLTVTPSPSIGDTSVRDQLVCDPFELVDGELRLGIGTNQPATVTITYWPQGNRADARELSLFTPESQVALFEADLPSEGDPALVLKHCIVLDGLDPNARYEVRVVAETPGGELLERTITVSLRVNLGRPPARIVPVGDNMIVVSAMHRYGETMLLRGVLHDDDYDYDCSTVETGAPLRLVGEPVTQRSDTEWLARNGFSNQFTERTSGAFYVPEGRNALVCLSSYDDSRPSWNWEVADYTYSSVVQAPDYTVPRVTWINTTVRPSARLSEVTVVLGPRGGGACAARGITVPFAPERYDDPDIPPLCAGVNLDGFNYYNTGHLIVRAGARVADGVKWTSAGLPLGFQRCAGFCDTLPERSYYTIALPLVPVPSGLCGSSFGDCDPPTSSVSGGTVHLRVDWEHGARNGAESWSMGPIVEAEGVPFLLYEPQFDRTAVPRYVNDASGRRVEFDLRSDRPVNYRATLLGDCFLPETVTVVEGRWENLGDSLVSFANPCRGATYSIHVDLIDDEGVSAAYGPTTSGSIWWSYLDIPGTTEAFNVSYRLTLIDDDGRGTSMVYPTFIEIGGHRFLRTGPWGDRCAFGAIVTDLDGTSTIGVELPDVVPITATLTMRDGLGLDLDADADGFADCDRDAPGGDTITVETSVLLSELRSTGRYTVTAENERLRLLMTITLRD
ncbi:hypothetical protein [Microcella sp.]|uniref:hypothetical protein n=1 Tax=Microcella sp. TaxID=1913979 RepID=UPI00256035E7|nr:hypothetical protein [Microcella sp.]MBX9471699.1 hypothetical protein [Microcella sp.]